jgi:hypothetical protein
MGAVLAPLGKLLHCEKKRIAVCLFQGTKSRATDGHSHATSGNQRLGHNPRMMQPSSNTR